MEEESERKDAHLADDASCLLGAAIREALLTVHDDTDEAPALICADSRPPSSQAAAKEVDTDGDDHISFRQLRDWIVTTTRLVLSTTTKQQDTLPISTRIAAIALPPFSAEESAATLLVVAQDQWTFVPIDVTLPLTRQLEMMRIAGAHYLLTWRTSSIAQQLMETKEHPLVNACSILPTLPAVASLSLCCLQLEAPSPPPRCGHRHAPFASCAPLYILFTSGSTGMPKGVIGTREGAFERLQWMWRRHPFVRSNATTKERVARTTRLSFVDAIAEILGTVLQRIALVHLRVKEATVRSVVLHDPRVFLAFCHRLEISRITLVPSVLVVFVDCILRGYKHDGARMQPLMTLRMILVSGEVLRPDVVAKVQRMLPQVTLLHLYGSTEVSGDVTAIAIHAPLTESTLTRWRQHGVPIGIWGDVIGCSTSLRLVAMNEEHTATQIPGPPRTGNHAGELWVTGAAVALGYLTIELQDRHDQAAITQDTDHGRDSKWATDSDGTVWFRMGDYCRVIDGELFYQGRQDRLVKIRGNRLQLEDVECRVTKVIHERSAAGGGDGRAEKAGSCLSIFDQIVEVVAMVVNEDSTDNDRQNSLVLVLVARNVLLADLSKKGDTGDGNDLSCFDTLRHDAKAWLYGHLQWEYGNLYVPYDVVLTSHLVLPRLSSGKVDCKTLASQYQSYCYSVQCDAKRMGLRKTQEVSMDTCVHAGISHMRPSICSGTGEIRSRVEALITSILKVSGRVDDEMHEEKAIATLSWIELGGNSMNAALLSWELEQNFSVRIAPHHILESTFGDLVTRVVNGQDQSRHVHDSTGKAAVPLTIPSASTGRKRRRSSPARGVKNDSFAMSSTLSPWHPASGDTTPPPRLSWYARCNRSSTPSPLAIAVDELDPTQRRLPVLSLSRAWSVDLHKCVDASPLLVREVVNSSHAVDTKSRDVQNQPHERVYAIVGSHSGQVVCISVDGVGSSSTRERWRQQLDDRIEAAAALSVTHALVFVATYSARVYALTLDDGRIQWSARTPRDTMIKATPVVLEASNLVVVATYGGVLRALSGSHGAPQWEIPLAGSVFSTPVWFPDRERFLCATTTGVITNLSLPSGSTAVAMGDSSTTIWTKLLPAPVFASLAIAPSAASAIGRSRAEAVVIVGCANAHVYGLSEATGDTLWQVATGKPIFSSPCVYGVFYEWFVIGSHDGQLRKISTRDGSIQWTCALGDAPVFASPCVFYLLPNATRAVVCGATTSGQLAFCDERSGQLITLESNWTSADAKTWHGATFSSPVILDACCIVGTRSNHVVAFHFDWVPASTTKS